MDHMPDVMTAWIVLKDEPTSTSSTKCTQHITWCFKEDLMRGCCQARMWEHL